MASTGPVMSRRAKGHALPKKGPARGLPVNVDGTLGVSMAMRALTRRVTTGISPLRGVPRDLQRAVREREDHVTRGPPVGLREHVAGWTPQPEVARVRPRARRLTTRGSGRLDDRLSWTVAEAPSG